MQIHGDALRFGLHAGPQHCGYDDLVELWTRAEDLGYDWVSVFDHFLPIFSDPAGPCLEATALLGALAARTTRVRVGVVVTGVTYRHPAVAANVAATLDQISHGRLEYGLGAAWNDLEHAQYGIPFPPISVRMDMLDEACRVMRALWTGETTTFAGEHYRLTAARLEPKPVQARLPLVVGGVGERRTLRIVAEHADVWNAALAGPEDFRRKLEVLERHCDAVGRDPGDIRKSLIFRAVLRDDEAQARARREALRGGHLHDEQVDAHFAGTPEQFAERLAAFAELGAGDFLIGCAHPWDWETVELIAERVAPAVRAG